METIFSEVFNKNDWQILFDNLFSNHPGFLLYLVVSYSICNRTALLQVKELDDAKVKKDDKKFHLFSAEVFQLNKIFLSFSFATEILWESITLYRKQTK